MAKHRRQQTTAARRIATASAVAVGATVLAPGLAQAEAVTIPGVGVNVDVPGVENIPGIEAVPGAVQEYLPSADAGAGNLASFVPAEFGSSALPAHLAAAAPSPVGQKIVNIAYSKVGAPYAWGAAGPDAFDCSGFTSWVYSQVGKTIPRTSQAQASAGTPVAYENLQPGDIVAFYGGASHVGIYVGNGKIVDALNSGTPVGERSLDFMPFHSAVRF